MQDCTENFGLSYNFYPYVVHFFKQKSTKYQNLFSYIGLFVLSLSLLIFLYVISFIMKKFWDSFTRPSSAEPIEPDSLLIKHGKKTLKLEFDKPGQIDKGEITVGEVRKLISDQIKIPPSRTILIYAGQKLSDDKSPLNVYKVRSKSFIRAVSSDVNQTVPRSTVKSGEETTKFSNISSSKETPKASAKNSKILRELEKKKLQNNPTAQIDAILKNVTDTLLVGIENFEKNPPSSTQAREDEHRKLSELILQDMVKLDGVETNDNPDIRQKRKSAINQLHNLHSRIDAANEKLKQKI